MLTMYWGDIEAADYSAGKASYTDLMLMTPKTCIALEAKWTEPEYESVRSWLREPVVSNRVDVLSGWLSLLNRIAARPVDVAEVLDLPHQLIHRSASACRSDRASAALIYLVFGAEVPKHYVSHVQALETLLGSGQRLQCSVLSCQLEPSDHYRPLLQQWDGGGRQLAVGVREALAFGPAFTYSPLRVAHTNRPALSA